MQLIREAFFRDCISVVVDTLLPRFEALGYVLPHFDDLTPVVLTFCLALTNNARGDVYVLPHFDELTHVVIRAFSAFIILPFAEV